MASPLNKKLRKGQLRTFDELADDEITDLETLKVKLLEPLEFALPLSQSDHTLYMDACDRQIGCILPQKQPDGTDRPIG